MNENFEAPGASAGAITELELLRAAVARLREVSGAATPGPWSAANEHELLGLDAEPAWCVSAMRPGYASMSPTEGYIRDVAETSLGGRHEADQPDAAHIALADPLFTSAVADWMEIFIGYAMTGENARDETAAALAVARRVLGEEAGR